MTTLEDVRRLPGLDSYLEEVELRLAATVASRGGRAAEVGADALAAGGKRLRPLLAFLCAPPGEPPPVAAGVAVELVHMATLVHDDLIDGAAVRRGRTAAWAAHGADAARATGDYLFARAFAELAADGDVKDVAVLADASLCLARGEAMQRRQRNDPDTPVEAYLERCALKTGKLFEAACSLGSGGGWAVRARTSALHSRSPTTSSTAPATRSRRARSRGPTCARGRRRCRSCSPRARTAPCARRSRAGRSRACSCASPRRARSSAPGRWRSTTLGKRGKPSNGGAHREELESLADAVVNRETLMAILARTSTLEPIREKVEAGERLDFEDGLALLESDDLLGLGELADRARRLRGGTDEVYFVQNLYLNQTNVCRVKCKFCAFAATQKQEHAYTISTQELVEDAVRQRELTGFTEIHMVNGENPHVDFDFYVDAVRSLHEALPDVHLKMFTASEIHHMTKLSGLTHEEVLRELKAAGLGSLPGGGAEVFADRVRKLVAPGKEHPDYWFRTHDAAHRLGIPTHCTMLYGHVETYEERVDHLLRLRDQQDETGGFLAFIPLAFHPENTVFERRGWRHTTGSDDLKMLAVSRLLLDNIANIKAYWIMMGMPLAAVALHFGANDVQGTVVREQIFHAAGAVTETEQKIEELVRFVRDAGRIPVQRDTLYQEVRRWSASAGSRT